MSDQEEKQAEELRILRAAKDERLRMDLVTGRYVIDGEARPDFRCRCRLHDKAMLGWPRHGDGVVPIMRCGAETLAKGESSAKPVDLDALLGEVREKVGQITARFYGPTVPECTIEWDDDGDAQFVSGDSLESALRAVLAEVEGE